MQTSILIGLVLAAFIAQALGHSYLTNPISRSNQRQTLSGCRGPACLGPCDIPLSAATRAPIIAHRGDEIVVQWPRNNHAGGFIRLSWVPTSQSDSASAFDNGVQQINCHEVVCHPDDPTNPNGGDSGPSDGSTRACNVNITIPSWVSDGSWTFQWAWFGGAFALGDYYSCVDYTVAGGSAVTSQAAAIFVGGDYTYPAQQKCKFFNTDRLHECVDEPCSNPIYPLSTEESGAPFGFSGSAATPAPVTQAPSTPAPVTQAPSTPAPVTQAPATQAPATQAPATNAPVTQSPASHPPSHTPKPVTQAPTSNDQCVLGHQACTSSTTYHTCSWATRTSTGWSVNQACPVGLSCHAFQENYVWCY